MTAVHVPAVIAYDTHASSPTNCGESHIHVHPHSMGISRKYVDRLAIAAGCSVDIITTTAVKTSLIEQIVPLVVLGIS